MKSSVYNSERSHVLKGIEKTDKSHKQQWEHCYSTLIKANRLSGIKSAKPGKSLQ